MTLRTDMNKLQTLVYISHAIRIISGNPICIRMPTKEMEKGEGCSFENEKVSDVKCVRIETKDKITQRYA